MNELPMTGAVTAIVLAAGESRRMGRLKPLLPYGSGTVIQAVVRALQAAGPGGVLVVLGHRAEEIAASLEGSGTHIVLNPRYAEGMLTSVQAGLAAAPPGTEWFLIALGDQPSLKADVAERLIQVASTCGKGIVVPSFSGRRGHPLLIHARYAAEIASLDPNVGLRGLMLRRPDDIHHEVIHDAAVLADMDTPEDYERELRRLGKEAGS